MQLEKYIAGNHVKHPTGYSYFFPTKVNDEWIWEDQIINKLIEKAAIKLGELNSYLSNFMLPKKPWFRVELKALKPIWTKPYWMNTK